MLLGAEKSQRMLAFGFVCIFLFSQLHICVSNYVTNMGVSCEKCVQIEPNNDCDATLASSHGDCHDCCSLRSCEDGNQAVAKVVSGSSFELVVVLPAQVEVVIYQTFLGAAPAVPFDPSAPTTGPPLSRSSRAPPVI